MPTKPRMKVNRSALRAYLLERLAVLQDRLDTNPCGNPCDTARYWDDSARRAELERLAYAFRVTL